MRAMKVQGKKPATYEDLVALPDNVIGEILAGELVVSPRPASGHIVTASSLGMELGFPFQQGKGGPGGWWILDEPELHLGPDVLVPDVAGWRRERLPKLPAPGEPFFTLAPDWVCEILSPSTTRIDRFRKLPIYSREQVQHVWLLDPLARTLEVFRRDASSGLWMFLGIHGGPDRVRAEPFEAIELNLTDVFGPAEPSTEGGPGTPEQNPKP